MYYPKNRFESILSLLCALLAQLVEQDTDNIQVVGSIPTKGTNKTFGSSMVKLHNIVRISIDDFIAMPCSEYNKFKDGHKYDIFETITQVRGNLLPQDLAWLIEHCPKIMGRKKAFVKKILSVYTETEEIFKLMEESKFFHTKEVAQAYIKASKNAFEVYTLMKYFPNCAPRTVRDLFLKKSPNAECLFRAIRDCPICRTPKVLKAFIAASPNAYYLGMAIVFCKYCRTPKVIKAFLESSPTERQLSVVMKNCDDCHTPELRAAFLTVTQQK